MSRKCSTCQHVKRAEIDRRLAAGEPASQIAKDYNFRVIPALETIVADAKGKK